MPSDKETDRVCFLAPRTRMCQCAAEITIWCRGRFPREVGIVSRPDDVASIRVRRDKLPSITTECQTLQLLKQVITRLPNMSGP